VRFPKFQEGKHYIDSRKYPTSKEIGNTMAKLLGIYCYVHKNSPRVGVRRAINTLNYLYKGKQYFARERQFLLANNFLDLDPVNYFAKMIAAYSTDIVNAEI